MTSSLASRLGLGVALATTAVASATVLSAIAGLDACGANEQSSDAGGRDAIARTDAAGDDVIRSDGGQPEPEPSCEASGPGFAPVLDGSGAYACIRVGPAALPLEGQYADSAGHPTPVAYVRAGSTDPSPDGTQAHPFATIDAALAALPTVRTLLLSSDASHRAPSSPFVRALDVIGAGDRFTTLVAPSTGTAASPAYTVSGQGLGTDVRLEGLAIDGSSLADPTVAGGVRVTDSASVTLHNVTVRSVARGIQAETSATVHTDGVLVQNAGVVGLFFASGSDGDLKGLEVRESAGPGIFATASHVNVTVAWVHGSGQEAGVVLEGGTAVHRLDRLTVQDNAGAGLVLSGAAQANLSLVLSSGAGADPLSHAAGYGLVATGGSQAVMDTSIQLDSQQGHGSWFSYNDSAGLVVDGAMGATRTDVEVTGALVRHNLGVGLMFQDGGGATQVAYSQFNGNVGAGVLAAGDSRIGLLKCNGFIANVLGALRFEHGAETLGDGLVLAYSGTGAVTSGVNESLFAENARYGAFFVGAHVALQGNAGLLPGAQQVAVDSTATVSGYAGVPATDVRGASLPTANESLPVPAFPAP